MFSLAWCRATFGFFHLEAAEPCLRSGLCPDQDPPWTPRDLSWRYFSVLHVTVNVLPLLSLLLLRRSSSVRFTWTGSCLCGFSGWRSQESWCFQTSSVLTILRPLSLLETNLWTNFQWTTKWRFLCVMWLKTRKFLSCNSDLWSTSQTFMAPERLWLINTSS